MSNPQDWQPVVPGGFKKGADPRRQPGGLDPKTRRVRKALAKMDGKALALLESYLDSGEPDLALEALKLWAKYRLPVPTEKTPGNEATQPQEASTLRPELAKRLAKLQ